MSIDHKLRKRIKVLLVEHDMDQKKLAAKTGMSEASISNFLSGQTKDVKYSTLEAIATALGCTLEILFKDIQSGN